jgi:hypothetical protein
LSSSARQSKTPPPPPSAKAARERAAGGWEASQPEIRVAYAPAGRETLEAITAEIVGGHERHDSLPEIQVREAPAGRETLAAIAEELRPAVRPPLDTIPYADQIKNAPGAHTPSMTPALRRAALDTAPDLSVQGEAVDGNPLAAVEPEALSNEESASSPSSADAPPTSGLNPIKRSSERPVAPETAPEPLEIFEMATFVVRGPDAARLSTDALRRRFVEEHLMHRLPVTTLDEIDRVDVTPWTVRGTFVVRVWCKVAGIEAIDIRAE